MNFYALDVFPSLESMSSYCTFSLSFFPRKAIRFFMSTESFVMRWLFSLLLRKGVIFLSSLLESLSNFSSPSLSTLCLGLRECLWFYLSRCSSLRCYFSSLFFSYFFSRRSDGVARRTLKLRPLNKELFLASSAFFISAADEY